jgi:hypothetical protein
MFSPRKTMTFQKPQKAEVDQQAKTIGGRDVLTNRTNGGKKYFRENCEVS